MRRMTRILIRIRIRIRIRIPILVPILAKSRSGSGEGPDGPTWMAVWERKRRIGMVWLV